LATDDKRVDRVEWKRVTGLTWAPATFNRNTRRWNKTVPLYLGTETLEFRASDYEGKFSEVKTLTVTRRDEAPVLTIMRPTASAVTVSAKSFVVAGTATDDIRISAIQYRLSTGARWGAIPYNRKARAWKQTIPLKPGTSSYEFRARDSLGNYSDVRTLTVTSGPDTAPPVAKFSIVASFNGENGAGPTGPLVEDASGNFLGVCAYGGEHGFGTIFRAAATGQVHRLASFDGENGEHPNGILPGPDGNYYGTTLWRRFSDRSVAAGQATFFRVTPDGSLSSLFVFKRAIVGLGEEPSEIVLGPDGIFYGTTGESWGGIGTTEPSADGSVFRITTDGSASYVKRFADGDGEEAIAGTPSPQFLNKLILGMDGYLYGTTATGGYGYGVLFRIRPNGQSFSLISLFYSGPTYSDLPPGGGYPRTIVQAVSGEIYGITGYGGKFDGGTIYKWNPHGYVPKINDYEKVTTLVHLGGGLPRWPNSLILASDGNFYGTTEYGPTNADPGTIFRMTPAGVFTTLVQLDEATHGLNPGYLMQGKNGKLYGTTDVFGESGGPVGGGKIFELDLGLPPRP